VFLWIDTNVLIEYVKEISVLDSGKKKEVLNTYTNPI